MLSLLISLFLTVRSSTEIYSILRSRNKYSPSLIQLQTISTLCCGYWRNRSATWSLNYFYTISYRNSDSSDHSQAFIPEQVCDWLCHNYFAGYSPSPAYFWIIKRNTWILDLFNTICSRHLKQTDLTNKPLPFSAEEAADWLVYRYFAGYS